MKVNRDLLNKVLPKTMNLEHCKPLLALIDLLDYKLQDIPELDHLPSGERAILINHDELDVLLGKYEEEQLKLRDNAIGHIHNIIKELQEQNFTNVEIEEIFNDSLLIL